MHDQIISLIRTWVPVGVGFVLTWLSVHVAFVVDENTTAVLIGFFQSLVTALFYLISRSLERVNPAFGWLLGAPKAPNYVETTGSPKE